MEFLPEKIDQYSLQSHARRKYCISRIKQRNMVKSFDSSYAFWAFARTYLSMFSQMIQPKTILEIGTYTGYSAICLAEGLQENGSLHTIDINEELKSMCRALL